MGRNTLAPKKVNLLYIAGFEKTQERVKVTFQVPKVGSLSSGCDLRHGVISRKHAALVKGLQDALLDLETLELLDSSGLAVSGH